MVELRMGDNGAGVERRMVELRMSDSGPRVERRMRVDLQTSGSG